MVDELTTEIDVRSSLLVKELASRDDIIYERELKNTFIALCHKVSRLLSLQHRKNLLLSYHGIFLTSLFNTVLDTLSRPIFEITSVVSGN